MARNRRWIWAVGAFLASMAVVGARAAVQRPSWSRARDMIRPRRSPSERLQYQNC